MPQVQDLHVRETVPLIAPRYLKAEEQTSDAAIRTVAESRETIKKILAGEDPRLMVVIGPCSIHDHTAALEYARRLKALSDRIHEHVYVVMRVYFEKPRTTVGWKGLINDPHLNDTFDIPLGLRLARRILLEVTSLGLPTATELLEPITPQYIADLISLAAIGARTTESPTHRQMASGLSMPVGFKNGTDGGLQVAVDAMQSARTPHSFLGIDAEGKTCIINTTGNPWGLLVLRGGRTGPNYEAAFVQEAVTKLKAVGLPSRVLVDCSHANSNKDYTQQKVVWEYELQQHLNGDRSVTGMMVESNLLPGNQPLGKDPATLKYGVSITDPCIGWEETERLLLDAAERLATSKGQTLPPA